MGTNGLRKNLGLLLLTSFLLGGFLLAFSLGVLQAAQEAGQSGPKSGEAGKAAGWPAGAATNAVSQTVYLPVIRKPEPIPKIFPIGLTCGSNDWTVSWRGEGSAVTYYELQESLDAQFTAPTTYTTTNISRSFSYLPSTDNVYYYQVRAHGSWGASVWSDVVNVVGVFLDDFSDATSGWLIADNNKGRFEYLGGEYAISTKKSGFIFRAESPDVPRQDYAAEAEIHWQAGSPTNGLYGLMFGAKADLSKYYVFAVLPSLQEYWLFFFDADAGVRTITRTTSSAINIGTATNQLKVTRVGPDIKLAVNGIDLVTQSDSEVLGQTLAGVMSSPNTTAPATEVRFDDFQLSACDSLGQGGRRAGSKPPAARAIPGPADRPGSSGVDVIDPDSFWSGHE